jgi:hypothetical protein
LSGRKKRKLPDTKDRESASDSDFEVKRSNKKEKRKTALSRSVSAQESRPQGGHYRLRKRNTVPVVEVSDSDKDNEKEDNDKDNEEKARTEKVNKMSDQATSNVDSRKHTDDIEKKRESSDSSMEDVVVVETPESKSKYFSNSGKRKLTNSTEKIKLSLKKARGGKEAEQESVKSKSEESMNFKIKSDKFECDMERSSSDTACLMKKKISKDKSRNQINKLSNDNPSNLENKSFLNDSKKGKNNHDSQKSNVNSILMQKACGSNEKDTESLGSSKDGKSDKNELIGKHKKGLVNGKSISKPSVKSKSGLIVNETTDSNKVDTDKEIVKIDDKDNADEDVYEDVREDGEKVEYRVPYYLENFKKILESVLDDKENARLFDEMDMKYITTFNNLDGK